METDPIDDPPLAAKLAHLARPESYREGTAAVEAIETHWSYVFLTERHAYKLKKPVRDAYRDFSSLEGRRRNCVEEVRLNRRLAPDVYLGVVPLAAGALGLQLAGDGTACEWLVKMRRLPRRLMLDDALSECRVSAQDITRFMAVLGDFYNVAERTPLSAGDYRARLSRTILDNSTALADARYGLERALLGRIADAQLAFLERGAELLASRAGRLVDGHGDLRPEHVCLSEPPVFIDCLEFDASLRIVDPADEVAYLALECMFVGEHSIAAQIVDAYRVATADRVDETLIRYYQACRAVTRAKLAAWHLDDALPDGGRQKWIVKARDYLELAAYLLFSPAGAPPPSRLRAAA
jgi:aminoglycoside phosphotransferase family enzyme